MGQQVSVETLTTRDTDKTSLYWCSFEPYPHKVGKRKLTYIGVLNGEGPRKGEKCIVKAFRNGCGTYEDWLAERERSHHSNLIAKRFHKEMEMQGKTVKMHFTIPLMVEIDEVSNYMCVSFIIGKPHKKMRELEVVSLEPYYENDFKVFKSDKMRSFETTLCEAFTHFSWYSSNGELIVTNLKGVRNMNQYEFTVPIIHSKNRNFGATDYGSKGIKDFFREHQCNEICNTWPRPDRISFNMEDSEKSTLERFQIHPQESIKPKFGYSNNIWNPELHRFYIQNINNEETVHCQKENSCFCEYFRLPCQHIMSHTAAFIYNKNQSKDEMGHFL